ncbi:aldo/keto reductase family oxidoreductase [Paraferrimonas sp. SM1919]|uniref:aldo/keto reductase n=1 Tax=Paraferrimonas sp. SM1919 TaxID=2662263 RepID=UPI0013D2A983|nr:aldo/keto reductase [Paraferrimonas sp. SM1919]
MKNILSGKVAAGFWRLCDWHMSTKQLQSYTEALLARGITVMDHADIYGAGQAEAQFGTMLKQAPSLREQMVLVSKCGVTLPSSEQLFTQAAAYDNSKAYIISQVERSLTSLNSDHLDLLLVHRPDYLMQHDEIAEAMLSLQQQGKVKTFGVSNFDPVDVAELKKHIPLQTNQIELSVVEPKSVLNRELVHYQNDMVTMAWSPFAGGRLFNANARLAQALMAVAKAHDATVPQIALAWIYALPQAILPVLGTGKIERVDEALGAAEIPLTKRQWYYLLEASTGVSVP